MAWSGQQAAALQKVAAWLRNPRGPQVFRLFGFAGSGKTTLAIEIAGMVRGRVTYMAYTGKAAMVMRSKGCANARTIHSVIYMIKDPDAKKPEFVLNPESEISFGGGLAIIDECSMLGEDLGRDLLSYGTRILVLGDPFQLPPINGTGFFDTDNPDVMLTEIHRQAQDNPIIRMSMELREGRRLAHGNYGDSRVISRLDKDGAEVKRADQIIVGKNATRRAFNAWMRKELGYSGDTPVPGERLICLRNDRVLGLLNGSMWRVRSAKLNEYYETVSMLVAGIDMDGRQIVDVPLEFFAGTEGNLDWRKRRENSEFTYGYAITCHKSQGSQYDDAYVIDESASFRENASKWLYTAVTRAAKRVTVAV